MSEYKNNLQEGTQIVLNNLSEEYKNLLIERAIIQNNLKRTEDILPEDIIAVNEDFRRFIKVNEEKTKREKSISLVKLTGLLYTVVGIFLYLYINMNTEEFYQQISLLLVALGSLVYISALFSDQIYMRRKTSFEFKREDNEYKLVRKWNEIEMISYLILREKEGISGYIPIFKVVKILVNEDILDIDDEDKFRYILHLRNKIVHSTENRIDTDSILEGIKLAEGIIKKLERYKNEYKF